MIGVIDVGGGLRGSYGAGVLDRCIEEGIRFDCGVGVSAGSANVASYLGGQKGRNYVFYTDYFQRWQYMGIKNLLKTGSYVGLDYIYSDLSGAEGENPLNWKGIAEGNREMITVATNALTGEPTYFDRSSMSQDYYEPIKASCCVPVADRPYYINGIPYFDGGISDPVPLDKAFSLGCDKVVLILTRPKDFRRISKNDTLMADLLRKHYPAAAEDMRNRSLVYNQAVDRAMELEKEGKVLIVAPDSIGKMKTLTKDREAIAELYAKGYVDAEEIKKFVQE